MKHKKNKNKQLLRLSGKFQPWDWEYLIAIEKQMLKQMQEYHETARIIEDSQICMKIKID